MQTQTQTQPLNNAAYDKLFSAFPLEAKGAMIAYGASLIIAGGKAPATSQTTRVSRTRTQGRRATAAPAAAPKTPTELQTRVLERIRSRGSAGIQRSDIVLEGVGPNNITRALNGLKALKLATSRGPAGNLVWFAEQEQKQQAA